MNVQTPVTKRPFKARPDDINVVERDESRYNERLMTVMPAMVKAIGGVVREHNVTRKEYQMFRDFLQGLAAAPFGTIGGISDAWLESVFDHTTDADWEGTRANPEGPLYVRGVPLLDPPAPGKPYVLYRRGKDEPGTRLLVSGKVLSLGGKPVSKAELDIWQASDTGLYSSLGMDDQPQWNLRGRILADEEGNYEFLTVRPPPYCTPGVPEILYELFALMGRSYFRPAHVHIRISHPDVDPDFYTQLYFKGDPYVDYDIGLADSSALRFDVETIDDPAELERLGLDAPFLKLHCDFRIQTVSES